MRKIVLLTSKFKSSYGIIFFTMILHLCNSAHGTDLLFDKNNFLTKTSATNMVDVNEETNRDLLAKISRTQEETSFQSNIVIPDIAKGHEKEYLQFLKGKLVYKPNKEELPP